MSDETGKIVGDAGTAGDTSATPPATQTKTQTILQLIQLALSGLGLVVPGTAEAGVIGGILAHALLLWRQETGQPIDFNKIPFEEHVL